MAFGGLIFSRGQSHPHIFSLFFTLCTGLFIQQHTPFRQAELPFQRLGRQQRHQPWAAAHGQTFRNRASNSTSYILPIWYFSQCFLTNILIFLLCHEHFFFSKHSFFNKSLTCIYPSLDIELSVQCLNQNILHTARASCMNCFWSAVQLHLQSVPWALCLPYQPFQAGVKTHPIRLWYPLYFLVAALFISPWLFSDSCSPGSNLLQVALFALQAFFTIVMH